MIHSADTLVLRSRVKIISLVDRRSTYKHPAQGLMMDPIQPSDSWRPRPTLTLTGIMLMLQKTMVYKYYQIYNCTYVADKNKYGPQSIKACLSSLSAVIQAWPSPALPPCTKECPNKAQQTSLSPSGVKPFPLTLTPFHPNSTKYFAISLNPRTINGESISPVKRHCDG